MSNISLETDITEPPRWPPVEQGIPAISEHKLLATQRELLIALEQGVGESPDVWVRHYQPVIRRYARWIHLLPASREHHHYGAGGLLRHGLEAALAAAGLYDRRVVGLEVPSADRKRYQQGMRWAAVIGAMLHDCAKPLTDVDVVGDRSGDLWNPVKGSLTAWLAAGKERRYRLRWRSGREDRHKLGAAVMLPRLAGADEMAWLCEICGQDALLQLVDAVTTGATQGLLPEIILEADRISVAQDLARRGQMNEDHRIPGVAAESHILDAARSLLRTGEWKPGGKVCLRTHDDHVLLAWPKALRDIGNWLSNHRIPGVMRQPDAILNVLLDTGTAKAGPDEAPTWRYRLPEGLTIAGVRLKPGALEVEGERVAGEWLGDEKPTGEAVESTNTLAPQAADQAREPAAPDTSAGGEKPHQTAQAPEAKSFRERVLECPAAEAVFGDLASGVKASTLLVFAEDAVYLRYPEAFAGYGMTPLQVAKDLVEGGLAESEGKKIAHDIEGGKGVRLSGFGPVYARSAARDWLAEWIGHQTEDVRDIKAQRYVPVVLFESWGRLFEGEGAIVDWLESEGLIVTGVLDNGKQKDKRYARLQSSAKAKKS
ncbi:MobH family relaxase [Acidihalobacter yilgarnensis]|nr:MobH family relaxase [Acidihalobacter yilgarnensis]